MDGYGGPDFQELLRFKAFFLFHHISPSTCLLHYINSSIATLLPITIFILECWCIIRV